MHSWLGRGRTVQARRVLARMFGSNPKPQIPSHQEPTKGVVKQATDLRNGPFGKTKTVEENMEAENLLNQKVSLRELRAQQLEKVDSEKFDKMIKIEEEIDLPYYLHGIQNKPDRKVLSM